MASERKVPYAQRGKSLDQALRERVRALALAAGEQVVADLLKVNRLTLARSVAGFTLQVRTLASIESRMADVDAYAALVKDGSVAVDGEAFDS